MQKNDALDYSLDRDLPQRNALWTIHPIKCKKHVSYYIICDCVCENIYKEEDRKNCIVLTLTPPALWASRIFQWSFAIAVDSRVDKIVAMVVDAVIDVVVDAAVEAVVDALALAFGAISRCMTRLLSEASHTSSSSS